MGNAVTIWYSDGTMIECASIADAELSIEETVIGSDFEVTVDYIDSDKWPNIGLDWSVEVALF